MRVLKKPEIRKQEIIQGALTVFLRKGFEKSTIADIAQELQISQGLCYRYFASKEEIYDAVIDTCAAHIVEENLRSRPREQSVRQWVDAIPAMLSGMAAAERDDPQLYSLLHSLRNQRMHRELCMQMGQRLIPVVADILEQGKKKGEIDLPDCWQTAVFGVSGEIGLFLSLGMACAEAVQAHWRMLLKLP